MTYTDLAAVPALAALRAEALRWIPRRHLGGDAAYVEMTETLCHDKAARRLTPQALAKRVTASLDQVAAEFTAEKE